MEFESVNSEIDPTAKVGERAIIINSQILDHCMIGRFSKIAYSQFGKYSYIGDYSVVLTTQIGKYSAISWGVTIGPEDHDYNRITNHSFLYSTKVFNVVDEKQYSPFDKKCDIGNDVWVGCNATILRGVSIGDGAVVGANTLVNKDVPPYGIVVGNPARLIKFRFSNEIIDALMDLKWWDWEEEEIKQNIKNLASNPTMELLNKLKKK